MRFKAEQTFAKNGRFQNAKVNTVQSHYNTGSDITWSDCGS